MVDSLEKAIIEEAGRRNLLVNATCGFCGEIFKEQELDVVLAHTEVCNGRK